MNCPKCNSENVSRECYFSDEGGVFIFEYYECHCHDCGCEFETMTTFRYEGEEILRVDGVDIGEEV